MYHQLVQNLAPVPGAGFSNPFLCNIHHRQIKQLEQELDCLLFERINHTVTLTEKGHELVSYAHKVRAITDEFKEGLSREDVSGHIHIVTPDSVCEEMIYSHYMEFHNKYVEY